MTMNATMNSTAPSLLKPLPERSLDKAAQSARTLLFFIFLEFVLLWLLCAALVLHLRVNRIAARRGDAVAAHKLVLPAFEPLLIVLGVFNAVFAVGMGVLLVMRYYAKVVRVVHLETYYSAHQFGLVLLVLFMLEKSVSIAALRRCTLLALVLSSYTVPYIWWVTTYGAPTKQRSYIHWLHVLRALVLLISVYVLVWPPRRATRRALRLFALYNIVRYLITTVRQVMTSYPSTRENAKYAMYATLSWVTLSPLVIWYVLRADTDYWRGVGNRASALLDPVESKTQQLLYEHSGRTRDGALHSVIETHRKHVIDFAYLDLRPQHQPPSDDATRASIQTGEAGAFTLVYGVYRGKHRVAVKVYEPSALTPDVVAHVSHEAALCSKLRHPNVVTFIGMCVSPPTIGLVFERCECTLEVLLRRQQLTLVAPERQQLLINVGYMLDAARAVAYLHSLSPPLVHCAIAPSSFVVDVDCNVKLAHFDSVTPLHRLCSRSDGRSTVVDSVWLQMPASPSAHSRIGTEGMEDLLASPSDTRRSTTAYFVAPEVLHSSARSRPFDQAADVYSLGVTLWAIASPSVDTCELTTHRRVFESVLGSVCARPALDTALPLPLRDAIQRAWHEEAHLRPSAQTVVAMIEDVQETLAAALVVGIMDELQLCFYDPEASVDSVVSGAAIADVLVDCGVVSSRAEAVRIGNACMDAGLLHHVRHTNVFESSATLLYYFAVESNATLRQLIRSTRHSVALSSSIIPMLVSPASQHHRQQNHHQRHRSASQSSASAASVSITDACACSRLAQRLGTDAKAPMWRRLHRKTLLQQWWRPPTSATNSAKLDEDVAQGG